MSDFVSEQLSPGDRLHVAGPLGTCFYEGVDPGQPLTLVGAGTGLAPLMGIFATRFGAVIMGRSGSIMARASARACTSMIRWRRSRQSARTSPMFREP